MTLLIGVRIGVAELPRPRLFTVHPAGIQAGKSIEVGLTGERIERLEQLRFSDERISATRLSPGKFRVTAPAEVRPQTVDVVGFGPEGVTNPRAFVVGDLPVVLDTGANDLKDQAQVVNVDVAIHGRIDPRADVDYFRVVIPKNRRVTVHVKATTIDSKLVPAVTVFDDGGRPIGHTGDFSDVDTPIVLGPFPDDRPAWVRIHDLVYNGGPEYWYRLEISTKPFVWFAWPPVICPNESKQDVSLIGWNLPGGMPVAGKPQFEFSASRWLALQKLGCEVANLDLGRTPWLLMPGSIFVTPSMATGDNRVFRSKDRRVPDLLIGASASPPVFENGIHETAATAQRVPMPCEIVASFDSPTEKDWYRFRAKKGQKIEVAAIADRAGLPGDLALLIRRVTADDGKRNLKSEDVSESDDDSTNPGGQKFNMASTDPVVVISPPSDGDYLVEVTDRYGLSTPRSMYRLRIGPPKTDVHAVVLPFDEANQAGINIDRGGNALSRLIWQRKNEGNNAKQWSLQSKENGVRIRKTMLPSATGESLLVLESTVNDKPRALHLDAYFSESENVKTNRGHPLSIGTIIWPAPPKQNKPARLARSPMVGVTSTDAPYRLLASEPAQASQGALLRIPLKLERRLKDFTGPLNEIKSIQPSSIFDITTTTIADKQIDAILHVRIQKSAAIGIQSLAVAGTAQVPWPQNPADPKSAKTNVPIADPSNTMVISVRPAPVELSLDKSTLSVKPGGTVKVVAKIKRKTAANRPVKLTLTLPPGLTGVASDAVTLPPDKSQAEIAVRVDAKVPPGDRTLLTIRASAAIDNVELSVDELLTLKVAK